MFLVILQIAIQPYIIETEVTHMTELEKYFCQVYDNLESKKYLIDSLGESVPDLEVKSNNFIKYIRNEPIKDINPDALLKFIIIQLDYYTFSSDGNVFISDSDYDFATEILKGMGISIPTTTHFQPSAKTSWEIKKHTAPQMVGSVAKAYDMWTVEKFIHEECDRAFGKSTIMLSPKYDGVGVCLEYDPKKVDIVSALTRKDGTTGQELIDLIRVVKNYDELVSEAFKMFGDKKGYIKCEILLAQDDFEELIKEKPYKNRRNGVSGIINTPSNIQYGKFLTVKPLIYGTVGSTRMHYTPKCRYEFDYNPDYMGSITEAIEDLLAETHNSTFKFRTDGVVIFINNIHMSYSNVMEHAIAFKTNSKVGITTIEYGYVSIGRSGKATPMIKVQPCDLNETVVTDVSLSNFNKVQKLGLHENDTVCIESSGDVIPMVREVVKQGSAMPLKFELKCPICGYNLVPYIAGNGVTEYECRNPKCARIISGRIVNFLDKLGANGMSDQTIMNVYESLNLKDIIDFLDTDKYKSDLMALPEWGVTSANNFCNEIDRIKHKPITHGEFLGAMGIPGISTKKCKSIFAIVDYNEFMKLVHEGRYDDADTLIYGVKGFSAKSIGTFMEFIKENMSVIDKLSEYFTLVKDKRSEANIVFTGFRDDEAEEYAMKNGMDVSDNINGQTVAVISANKASGKTKKAIERGIPVFDAYSAPLHEVIDYIVTNLK